MLKYFFLNVQQSAFPQQKKKIFSLVWNMINSGFVLHDGFDGERDYGHHVRDIVVFKSAGFERGWRVRRGLMLTPL